MLETFHQLRESPFGVNPDPRFLYLSRTHREAFSSLLYRIEMDSGFLAMVAQPGMGKTTLLFHLLQRLQPKARTAFIFQTQCTSNELLRHLLSEFECPLDTTDPVRVLQELKSMLVAEASAGRRCVMIVDEAQNLKAEVLETIRLLSNFETPRRKLLSIVLSGQSELGEMLARAELRQLRQRLSCIVQLEKFTSGEIARYIAHRLAVAGYSGQLSQLFTTGALARIADLSEGVPRVINNLCFNALSLSYALGARQIDASIVEEAALDLGLSGQRDAEPSDGTADEKEDADTMLEVSEALAKIADDATATAETSNTIADKSYDEPTIEHYGQEEVCAAAVAAPESEALSGSVGTSSYARRPPKESALARGFACVLVLLLTPAINRPANHTVAAQAIESSSSTKVISATKGVNTLPEPATPHTKGARVSRVRHSERGKRSSSELSRRYRASQVPVDLRLASFAPEPLLDTRPLEPMSISTRGPEVARMTRMRTPAFAPTSFDSSYNTARRSHYVPPKPVWQPAPSVPEWYRHPKKDVQLVLSISSRGEVSEAAILRGRGTLANAARRAAMMWRYMPALANGKPVNSRVLVTIQYLQH